MSAPWPTLQAAPNVDRPPWGWNPTQTFIDAYNTQRIADQKVEQMQMNSELERILFPAKVAEAEYNMKKLSYDSKLLEKIYRTQSAALDNSYRGINSAVGNANTPANNQAPSRRAAIDWSAWGNPSAQQTSDDLIP
jgi:hypothetical protein